MSELKTQNHNLNVKTNVRQRSFNFSVSIINYCSRLPSKKIYWIITDQLLRSATSIGANIIEAKAASSKKDFIYYYEIALKSANETIYWLLLIKKANLDNSPSLVDLISEAQQLAAMLGSSLITMKGKRNL